MHEGCPIIEIKIWFMFLVYSKTGKNSVYEKNPFLMPINKK
jgi:hypothetical protein